MTDIARRARGALVLLAALAGLSVLLPASAEAQDPAPAGPTVGVVRINGGIDAAYADYLRDEIALAQRRRFKLVVLWLESAGAIKADVEALLADVCSSTVPIAAWVGPHGEAVAGAATRLWLAADIGLVADGAEVRPPVPLQPGGDPSVRGGASCERNGGYAGSGLSAERTYGADALVRSGLADAKAGTIVEAVSAANQVTVDGRKVDIDIQASTVRNANPGLIDAVRQALATNPTLVYLLLLTGIGAIVFEAFQPGFGPAGYAGAILAALAAYGLVALPVSPPALAGVLLALGAMALDVRRNTLGVLTWGGTAVLVVSSRLLVHSNGPALRVPWPTIAFGVVGSLVFYVVAMTVVLRALRGQSAEMGSALVGRVGEVRSTLNPQGHVLVEGALWRARALEWDGAVPAGTRVTVTGVDTESLLLDVEPVDEHATP